MKHNGWRKPAPGFYDVEKHFEAGEWVSVPKTLSNQHPVSAFSLFQRGNYSPIKGRVQ